MSERIKGIKEEAIRIVGMPCPTPRQIRNSLEKLYPGDARVERYEKKLGIAQEKYEEFIRRAKEVSNSLRH